VADDLETAIAAGAVTALRGRAARQTELARLGTVETHKTPGVFIRTGESALADRLANAWASAGPGNGGRHEGSEGEQDGCDGSIARRTRRLQGTSGSGEGAENAEEAQAGAEGK
jgi:hypothetical protein